MTVEPASPGAEPFEPATAAEGATRTQRLIGDGLAAIERGLLEAARTADRLLRESSDTLRQGSSAYAEDPALAVEKAQSFLIERVKERPVTAAMAGLGLGFLLGVLISSRGR
jgi:ElaB/YqjD/DUF883 family membrane-anchored ribosome-binding protein